MSQISELPLADGTADTMSAVAVDSTVTARLGAARRLSTRSKLIALSGAAAFLLAACSSSGSGSGASGSTGGGSSPSKGGSSASSASTQLSAADDALIKKAAGGAMNPNVNISDLAPEFQIALKDAATPLTSAQLAIWNTCVKNPVCNTGQGTKTVAYIGDTESPYYSLSMAGVILQSIQSGQVKTITRSTSNADLGQFLAAFRQAIAQRVSVIVGEWGALASDMGPVLAQAKAAGIPVINGATLPPPQFAKLLAVRIHATACGMWQDGTIAQTLTTALKQKGITHPTYALFSGPPGNAYAASWQPCAEKAVQKLGWTKVYTGWNVWDPAGETQAAAALLASGKKPDVILTDIAATQFLQAYTAAKVAMPTTVISGSTDINALNAYQSAKSAGHAVSMYALSSQVWLLRAGVVAGLEIADGHKPSSTDLEYPIGAVSFDNALKLEDLSLPGNTTTGGLVPSSLVTQALTLAAG